MKILQETKRFVQQTLLHAEGGHDWFHIERVWKNAETIAKGEQCDQEVVALAALLHDIADSKFHSGDETLGPRVARNWLASIGYPEEKLEHIIAIIDNVSFKGGLNERNHSSIELDIVQDADRLDAIGAIGISLSVSINKRPLFTCAPLLLTKKRCELPVTTRQVSAALNCM